MDREVEALAKETMLAVDRAEQQAQETVRHAQEEAQRLRDTKTMIDIMKG